jgi:RNA polymerase sigma-70 factor (ECF subfamily)
VEADFESWYVVARPRLHPALAVWCGDADAASDALDEAFTRALERWERVSVMASPDGWVWRTAANHVRRTVRRRHRELDVLASEPGTLSAEGPAAPSDPDLQRAILELSPRQRTAIVLHYLADLPTAEVAAAMEVAAGTVHATLHQARARLADALGQPVQVPPASPTDAAVAARPRADRGGEGR